jgi:hypothetical protein
MTKRRWLRSPVLWFVLFLALGGFGWLHRDWVLKTEDDPQTLTAADLAANGPGDNHHVSLTDYELGEPVVVPTGQTHVLWFPVYARGQARAGGPPRILFRSRMCDTQAEIDAVRKEPPDVTGVALNGLPSAPAQVPLSVVQALPGFDPAKVWYLDETWPLGRYMVMGSSAGAGLCAALGVLTLVLRRRAGKDGSHAVAAEAPLPVGAGPVRRYRGAAGAVPPEVKALGLAESIHRPEGWLRWSRKQPALYVVGGLALTAGTLVAVCNVELPDGSIRVIFYLPILVGLFIAALPHLTADLATYIVFPTHLVIVQKNDYVVIPWDAIDRLSWPDSFRLNAPSPVFTADGQHFTLERTVQDPGRLYETIRSRLRRRLLPDGARDPGQGGRLDPRPRNQ